MLLVAAVLLHLPLLLWPARCCSASSLAAGSLGWNLGHNDFAPRGEETRYMALHVTLTGMRGLVAPPLGDRGLSPARVVARRSRAWALLLPLALVVAGAREFSAMRRHVNRRSAGA